MTAPPLSPSQGFVVVACDHPGSARYTQVDGEVIRPGGARSKRSQMEADRPADMLFLLDCMENLSSKGTDSRFAGRIDMTRCALTGMSFGGWSTAAALESRDPRVKVCRERERERAFPSLPHPPSTPTRHVAYSYICGWPALG